MTEPRIIGRFESGTDGMRHIFPLSVYWEDTDAGGIVYYANYLKFTERARTDMLRGLAINQQAMMVEEGANFVVRACEIEYLRPARMEDELEVVTTVTDLRGASLHMRQDINRGEVRPRGQSSRDELRGMSQRHGAVEAEQRDGDRADNGCPGHDELPASIVAGKSRPRNAVR